MDIKITRELNKTIIMLLLWLLPVYIAFHANNMAWLWLFVGSLFITMGVFFHYEELAKYENSQWEKTEE